MNTPSPRSANFWPLLAVSLLLAQCLLLYGHTGRDDAFLTYWPAHAFTEHGSILNYNSERVEQSSTLLLTLLLAGLSTLLPFMHLPTIAWGISMLAGAGTLWLVAQILQRQTAGLPALLSLAMAPCLVFWSSSGMEGSLCALLFTGLLLMLDMAPLSRAGSGVLALVVAASVLVRPEAFLILACYGAAGWLLTRQHHRYWLIVLASTAFTAALLWWWRLDQFGSTFPQPVSAKHTPFTAAVALKGIFYLWQGGDSLVTRFIIPTGFVAGIVFLFSRHHPQRQLIRACLAISAAQSGFILGTGGDWMDATRFLLPAFPALFLALLLAASPWPRLYLATSIMLVFLASWDSVSFASKASPGLAWPDRQAAQAQYLPAGIDLTPYSVAELQTKDALRDIPQLQALQTLVARLQGEPGKLAIASIQMGFIPYHLSLRFPGRLQWLDLRGLSTRELTDCWVLRNFPRSDTGIKISYDEFFGLLPNLQRQCGIRQPDILYDMGYAMRKDVLADNGYIIAWREPRLVRGGFSQRTIGSELFIAVRRELAARYGIADTEGHVPAIPPAITTTRPNIVLAIADDISYDDFSFMGNPAARTPTLDELARNGTTFTTGYVPTSFCRPTLATLLTGQWPHQLRLHANMGVVSLPPGTVTLGTRLQKSGYATFSGGKFWEDEPETRGFDAFDQDWKRFARHDQDTLWSFIDKHAGRQPLFIWWAPMLPHTPHNPPQQYLDAIDLQSIATPAGITDAAVLDTYRQNERVLLAMTLWFDDELNKLRQKLAEKGQLDNTLFIFLADNGFSHHGVSKNSPYELGLRTPIVFSWPGHIPAQRIDEPTSVIHLFSTALDYANLPPASTAPLSKTLRPVIEQQQGVMAEVQFGADYPSYTLKTDPAPRPERDIYALHIRDGHWKYIFYLRDVREADNGDLTIKSGLLPFPERRAGDEELFRLDVDPDEANNLATDAGQQQRLADYRRRVLAWWQDTGGKAPDALAKCPAQPEVLCRKVAAIRP